MTSLAENRALSRRAVDWAHASLPWLLSTSLHLALFLFLALNYRWAGGVLGYARPHQQGLTRGAAIDTSIGVADGDSDFALGMTLPTGTGEYYADDEPAKAFGAAVETAKEISVNPAPVATKSDKSSDATAASGEGVSDATSAAAAGSLVAMLGAGPGVDVGAMLPQSKSSLGALGASGSGDEAAGGGVPSAKGVGFSNQPSKGMRGGYARTGVFGVEGEGRKFVYVFDRSGSMDGHGGAPLAAAKAQLISSLANLGDVQQFQIIFYNEEPRVFNITGSPGRLTFATEVNKNQAKRFIEATTADGATEHEEALSLALRMGPDVIFFLTDADDPRLSNDQLERLERLNRGSMINTIEFGYGPPLESDNFLVRLARQNRGQHVYVDISKLPAVR